jgi:hypothetical protein
VRQFFQDNNLNVVERDDPTLPAYLRCQLWGYNEALALASPA